MYRVYIYIYVYKNPFGLRKSALVFFLFFLPLTGKEALSTNAASRSAGLAMRTYSRRSPTVRELLRRATRRLPSWRRTWGGRRAFHGVDNCHKESKLLLEVKLNRLYPTGLTPNIRVEATPESERKRWRFTRLRENKKMIALKHKKD